MKAPAFELFGWNTPNGQKILIALEEIGESYIYQQIDITNGSQHSEDYRKISPDGKIPALIHHDNATVTLFESGAILLYLADYFPALGGSNNVEKAKVTSWTFWQVGQLGPLAGQFGRFQIAEPANPAAVSHFEALVWRCLNVMETQLKQSDYLASNRFSIADIACFPWIASEQSYLQRYALAWREQCPAVSRWADKIMQRPSVIKALGKAAS